MEKGYINFAVYESGVAAAHNHEVLSGYEEVSAEERKAVLQELGSFSYVFGPGIHKEARKGLFDMKCGKDFKPSTRIHDFLTSLGYTLTEENGRSIISWPKVTFQKPPTRTSTFPTAEQLSKITESAHKKIRLDDEAKGKLAWEAFRKEYGSKLAEVAASGRYDYTIEPRPKEWYCAAPRLREMGYKVYFDDEDDRGEFMRITWS